VTRFQIYTSASALGFPRHATCSNDYPIPEPTLFSEVRTTRPMYGCQGFSMAPFFVCAAEDSFSWTSLDWGSKSDEQQSCTPPRAVWGLPSHLNHLVLATTLPSLLKLTTLSGPAASLDTTLFSSPPCTSISPRRP
jgi:hypothetical protein